MSQMGTFPTTCINSRAVEVSFKNLGCVYSCYSLHVVINDAAEERCIIYVCDIPREFLGNFVSHLRT